MTKIPQIPRNMAGARKTLATLQQQLAVNPDAETLAYVEQMGAMLKHGFWVVPDIADAARDLELDAAARRKRKAVVRE